MIFVRGCKFWLSFEAAESFLEAEGRRSSGGSKAGFVNTTVPTINTLVIVRRPAQRKDILCRLFETSRLVEEGRLFEEGRLLEEVRQPTCRFR